MDVQASPQLHAVGEMDPSSKTNSYASLFSAKLQAVTKTILKPVQNVHGQLMIQFSVKELEEYAVEGLHQAVVMKLSYGAPELLELRKIIPAQIGIKGRCLIDLLAVRQLLIRCDAYEDFVAIVSKQVSYLQYKGQQHQYRTFPWTQDYDPKAETSKTVAWVSFPDLPTNLFAKKPLLSIASAVGKPIAIDKATQTRTRPSTARVKVIIDLLDKHPKNIKLQFIDEKSGKVIEHLQEFLFDNLPSYCNVCKRQGHVGEDCRSLMTRNRSNYDMQQEENLIETTIATECIMPAEVLALAEEMSKVEKLKGDARDFLNALQLAKSSGSLVDVGKDRTHQKAHEYAEEAINAAGHIAAAHRDNVDSDDAGLNPVSSAIVPVAEALARVAQDLKAAKNTVVDRDLAGSSKGSAFEHGLMDDSALAAAVRAIFAKNNAAAAVVGQVDKAVKRPVSVGSQLEAKVALNATGNRCTVGVIKANAAQVDLTEKPAELIATAVQNEEQELEDVVLGSAAATGFKEGAGLINCGQETTNNQQITGAMKKGTETVEASMQVLTTTVKSAAARTQVTDAFTSGAKGVQQSKGGDFTVVNQSNMSPNKKNSRGLTNQVIDANNLRCSNSFDVLLNEPTLGDVEMNIQQVDHDLVSTIRLSNSLGSGKQQQSMKNADARSNVEDLALVPVDEQKAGAVPNAASPTLKISNPDLAKMVKDAQAAMFINTTPKIHAPLVTLNTTVHDIPSQSMESFGERDGDSGQQLLSTGNNQQVEKSMAAISQANYANKMLDSKEQQDVTSEFFLTRKTWADQREHEEDTNFDNLSVSEEEADHCSYTSNEGAVEVHKDQVSSYYQRVQIKKGLSPNAAVFVPAGQQQKLSNAAVLKEIEISSMHKAVVTGNNNTTAVKYNFTPTNVLHAIVSGQQQINFAHGQQVQLANSPLRQQQQNQSIAGAAVMSPNSEQQHDALQQATLISLEDRELLDALVRPKLLNYISPMQAASTGNVTKYRNNMQAIQQLQNTTALANTQEGNELITLDLHDNRPHPVNVGIDIYEEGEEDAILQQCRAEASRKGDLSPMHSGKIKKAHTRKNSWDDKVSDFLNVRRPPMRVAKQKKAAPTTSTRSNRSKKK